MTNKQMPSRKILRQGHHVSTGAHDGSGQQRVKSMSLNLFSSCLTKKLLQGLDQD